MSVLTAQWMLDNSLFTAILPDRCLTDLEEDPFTLSKPLV